MKRLLTFLAMALLLVLLPLLGVWAAGLPVSRYLEFPPKTRYVLHEPFSWAMFCLIGFFLVCVCGPFLYRLLVVGRESQEEKEEKEERSGKAGAFPPWAWLGVFLLIVAWPIAWTRINALAFLQAHTFTPLWISYILIVNGLTYWRVGRCPLTDLTGTYLLLFPLSAFFWWFFEYLNRFVQTWYYVGAGALTAKQYFFRATLAFSTVLPAILATSAFLATFPSLQRGLTNWVVIDIRYTRLLAFVVLLVSSLGLIFVGVAPNHLHALLWVSPLLIIVSLRAIMGHRTVFSPIKRGDWRPIWIPALAALICGLFWEMWNIYSLAKWHYSVPFVHAYLVFEMPILGYGGYLPFGLECLVIIELLFPQARESWLQ